MELGRGTRNTFLILFDAFCPLCAGESCTSERGLTPKGLQLVGVPPPETFQWSTVRSVKVLDATAKASEKYSKHASPIYQSNCIIMICFSGQGCVNVLWGCGSGGRRRSSANGFETFSHQAISLSSLTCHSDRHFKVECTECTFQTNTWLQWLQASFWGWSFEIHSFCAKMHLKDLKVWQCLCLTVWRDCRPVKLWRLRVAQTVPEQGTIVSVEKDHAAYVWEGFPCQNPRIQNARAKP